jgi:hypothetical protein
MRLASYISIEAESRQDASLVGKRRQVLIVSSAISIYFLIANLFVFFAGMADPRDLGSKTASKSRFLELY